jgi:hypothetical protein
MQSDLEKIEAWVRQQIPTGYLDNEKEVGKAHLCFDLIVYIQTLKAEKPQPDYSEEWKQLLKKPQPDKGEMAYEILMEFRNCASSSSYGVDLMQMIDFVQAKYKEVK